MCIHCTIDGATILRMMKIEHPIASLLVDISSSQDEQVGDGTTGVVLLSSALLHRAKTLIERGIHPHLIIQGYKVSLSLITL